MTNNNKFKIGDFVRFIDEKREGYVTRIIDELTLAVTDTDGFEIPVAKKNLTYVEGHYSNSNTENNAMPATLATKQEWIDEGLYLAVIEDAKNSVVAHFHLLNKSSYQVPFCLSTEQGDKQVGEFVGVVQANQQVKLSTVNLGELDQWPTYLFQALFFSSTAHQVKKPFTLNKRFKAKDFSQAKVQIDAFQKYGWLIRLDEPEVKIDAQTLKESFFTAKAQKIEISKPNVEIDLHIEKLRDDYQFLDSSEILTIQLNCFQQNLDAALVHKMDKLIFIHGVGNGTLQHQIHKLLSKHPQVRTFMDARKEKFGYGATEVVLT